MCGGGVRSILLLPLVARCLETIDVYGSCLFMSVCSDPVGVCGNVRCVADLLSIVCFLALEC